jgi:hypothetical protein
MSSNTRFQHTALAVRAPCGAFDFHRRLAQKVECEAIVNRMPVSSGGGHEAYRPSRADFKVLREGQDRSEFRASAFMGADGKILASARHPAYRHSLQAQLARPRAPKGYSGLANYTVERASNADLTPHGAAP